MIEAFECINLYFLFFLNFYFFKRVPKALYKMYTMPKKEEERSKKKKIIKADVATSTHIFSFCSFYFFQIVLRKYYVK